MNMKLTINTLRLGMLGEFAESFLCHAIRAILNKQNRMRWYDLTIPNCEQKLFTQFKAYAPTFFIDRPEINLTGTVLDQWLNWEVITPISLAGWIMGKA